MIRQGLREEFVALGENVRSRVRVRAERVSLEEEVESDKRGMALPRLQSHLATVMAGRRQTLEREKDMELRVREDRMLSRQLVGVALKPFLTIEGLAHKRHGI